MNGFNPSLLISDPSILFGRNKDGQLLSKLLINIRRGANCQLQGERRSGKTCTIKSLEHILSRDYENLIAIFFDFKESSIDKNDREVYRYLIAKIICELSKRKLIDEENKILDYSIKPNEEWPLVYEELGTYSKMILISIFRDLILFYSTYCNVGFVLLIDEYEYLMAKALESPVSFMAIRNLSDQPSQNTYKPLTYIIAGSKPFEKFCSEVGSPELNNISVGVCYTSPLSKEDFKEMWLYCLSKIDQELPSEILDWEYIYRISGAIPFYSKKLAESKLNLNLPLDFRILNQDFNVVFNNLSIKEKEIIKSLLKNQRINKSLLVSELIDRGILSQVNNTIKINGDLWEAYLKVNLEYKTPESEKQKIFTLVENISYNITRINRTYKSNNKDRLFELIDEEHQIRLGLQGENFENFASSIYKTVFERTASTVSGRRQALSKLPQQFGRNNLFVKIVDSLRQEFGGHLTSSVHYNIRLDQLTRSTLLLQLTGSKSEPDSTELVNIQIKVLELFVSYLNDILSFVNLNPTSRW